MLPNKQKQRFPATPGIAVSSLCIYKDTACGVSEPPSTDRMFPLILVVSGGVDEVCPSHFANGSFRTIVTNVRFRCGHKMSAPACYNISCKVLLWQKCATGQAMCLFPQTLKTDFLCDRRKSVFTCWDSVPNPLNSPLPGLAAHSLPEH